MDPTEFESAEGRLRFQIFREILRAVASHSGWIHTVSNWALGTTGVYVGLLVANLDKLHEHLADGWQRPVFWLLVISAVIGVGIQVASGLIQFSLAVENHLFPMILGAILDPGKYGIQQTDPQFPQRIITPVIDEFIESRPWAWGELAKYTKEKGEGDLVFLLKTLASWTQMMFVALVAQYILLGVAIFWPLYLVR
jgi:hypothetical protein